MEVADECSAAPEKLAASAPIIFSRIKKILTVLFFLAAGFFIIQNLRQGILAFTAPFLTLIVGAAGLALLVRAGIGIVRLFLPNRRMESIGKAVLLVLRQTGNIKSTKAKVKMESEADGTLLAYLTGGTAREKDLFAECLQQFFAPVDNQRYLLYLPRTLNPLLRYFCVPDILSKSKDTAALFQNALLKEVGSYDLIYTRNPEGRRILLKARLEAFANQDINYAERRKKVKSALE